MRGCSLLVSTEQSFAFSTAAGRVVWGFPVDLSAALYGADFYNQAFIVDPGANLLGVIGTNAGHGTIGY